MITMIIQTGIILMVGVQSCIPAKILCIFPIASYSHQQPQLALTHALAKRGHDLTVITSDPSHPPVKNHRDVDISFAYDILRGRGNNTDFKDLLQTRTSSFKLLSMFPSLTKNYCEALLKSHPIKELIRELNGTKFDLIIYESLGYSSLLGFSELVGNPPIIGTCTVHSFFSSDWEVGNPVNPAYVPTVFLPYQHRMTIWERFTNLATMVYFGYLYEFKLKPIQEVLLRKYFGNVKHTAEELENNKSLIIYSADLASGYPKPVQPNSIYVGSLHVKSSNSSVPLPDDLKKWMDEAKDGVIYFSLGSNMRGTSVPEEKRAAFIKAFSRFPNVRVLWKWESDERLPGQPENVLTKKWIPQQAALAHPKTKLFISQCGLQSFQEAIANGVPILGVPIFGDQDYNARKIETSGAGLSIEFRDITYEVIYEALKTLLTDSSFKENMVRLQAITTDKQMPALETAVWWVEYVLRHNGAPHLRPASLDLAWYQYFLLDVIGAFLIVLSLSIFVIFRLLKSITKLFTHNKVKTS